MSHGKLGLVAEAQKNIAAARQHYRTALAIIEPLAQKDPSNAQWRSDRAWVQAALARVQGAED